MLRRVAIIGSGPAGYTCSLYLARSGVDAQCFAGFASGGQLMLTSEVENFPGYPQGISGEALMADLRAQAERFGAEVTDMDIDVVAKRRDGGFVLTDAFGERSEADAVVVATGAEARWLGAEQEHAFQGRGISTCATCDGAFYKDKRVLVVGGGDSACGEALHLTHFASEVHLIVRRATLRASEIMQERVRQHPAITLHPERQVRAWHPSEDNPKVLGAARLVSSEGEEEMLPVDGAFLAIGHTPLTAFLRKDPELAEALATDADGYLVTAGSDVEAWRARGGDEVWGAAEGLTRSTVVGLFACGDVVDKRYRQAITAAGMGCQAALDVEEFFAVHGEAP